MSAPSRMPKVALTNAITGRKPHITGKKHAAEKRCQAGNEKRRPYPDANHCPGRHKGYCGNDQGGGSHLKV